MPGPNTRWLTLPSVPSSGGGSSSSALSAITAAVATNSIAWNGNIPQEWSLDTNTNNTIMFAATETTPSTGGTSSSGVPNQVMWRLGTLPTSTMSPLSVYSRGLHVFNASATTQQILAGKVNDGGTPAYSFTNSTSTGLAWDSTELILLNAGTTVFQADGTRVILRPGAAATPSGQAR